MTPTISEVYDILQSVESKFNLFDRKIDGVAYWERVRNNIYDEICTSAGVFGKANREIGQSWDEKFRGVYLWARNLVVRNPYLSSQHDYLFYAHPRRKRRSDGSWWDIYTDPIIEAAELDSLSIEYAHELEHKTPAATERLRYSDLINYSGTLYRLFSRYSIPDEERSFLQEVSDVFENEFGVTVDVADYVRDEIVDRKVTLPLYRRLLERVNPAVVVVVVSYGKETFIEACKEKSIPVVEIQHGTISPYHCGYSFPGDRSKETFPDYFLSFGEFWSDRVELPIEDENVYDVGYLHLQLEAEDIRESASEPAANQGRGTVLFISQGTIGESLSQFAVATSELAASGYDIKYKLHPDEYSIWKQEYPWLVDSEVEVYENSSTSLYELFARADVQVGVYSTALYEGLYFDLDTYVVDVDGVRYIQDLIDEGVITAVSSPQNFLNKLANDKSIKYDSNQFFEDNAVQNIEKRLNQIQNQECNDSSD